MSKNLIVEELRQILEKVSDLLKDGEEASAIANLEQARRLVEKSAGQINDTQLLLDLANNCWETKQFESALYFGRLSVNISKQKPDAQEPIIRSCL